MILCPWSSCVNHIRKHTQSNSGRRRLDDHTAVHPCKGALFNLEREVVTQAATRMSLGDIVVHKVSQTLKATYCMSPFL